MSITRANLEAVLVHRCGAKMAAAGMDGTTVAGTNADLNDPIRHALTQCGYSVVNIASVADADVSAVSVETLDQVLDIAELRTLESILGNLDEVDFRAGPIAQSFSQLATQIETAITRKSARIEKLYGIGLGTLTGGAIGLDFQEHEV